MPIIDGETWSRLQRYDGRWLICLEGAARNSLAWRCTISPSSGYNPPPMIGADPRGPREAIRLAVTRAEQANWAGGPLHRLRPPISDATWARVVTAIRTRSFVAERESSVWRVTLTPLGGENSVEGIDPRIEPAIMQALAKL